MKTQKTQKNSGDGNSNSSPIVGVSKDFKARNWFFTWNNYKNSENSEFRVWLDTTAETYVYQEEIGKKGTPHLQGQIIFKTSKSCASIRKMWHGVHWQKTRNKKAALAYCCKVETRNGQTWTKNFIIKKVLKDPLEGLELYPFQKDILTLIEKEPDGRSIYWFWDQEGCNGKTSLAKHICMNNNALYVQGKANDIKYGVSDWINEKGELDVLIVGIPRSYEKYVSYDAMESVVDGIFYSSKYESKMVVFNPPHVIVFANFPPDVSKMSDDRWVIEEIQ